MPTGYSNLGLTGLSIAILRALAAPIVCVVTLMSLIILFGVTYEDAYTGLAIVAALLYYIFMRSFAERRLASVHEPLAHCKPRLVGLDRRRVRATALRLCHQAIGGIFTARPFRMVPR